jgi:hypothetical protein
LKCNVTIVVQLIVETIVKALRQPLVLTTVIRLVHIVVVENVKDNAHRTAQQLVGKLV